jgi:hypothetical protein
MVHDIMKTIVKFDHYEICSSAEQQMVLLSVRVSAPRPAVLMFYFNVHLPRFRFVLDGQARILMRLNAFSKV